MEEKIKSISFRPTNRLLKKLARYMEATEETNKSEAIIAALECGIDTLESIGWDLSKDAAKRRASSALYGLPAANGGPLTKQG